MTDCIFCKIVKGELPCFKVYEDDLVMAFEDINPLSTGHTLIIPKKHTENIWEIPVEELTAIHAAAGKLAKAIREVLNPEGMACVQLNGRAVNQVVMHYHYHLIPKCAGDPALPVTEWELKAGDMEKIKKIGEEIAAAVKA